MSTTYQFQPVQSNSAPPFQFQPTLDGTVYTVTVTWSVYGRRFYLNISTVDGVLVAFVPMIGSPPDYPISMTKGYFDTALVFYPGTQNFVVG